MKVLFCGGNRSQNLIKAVQPRFRRGGVELGVEQNIENIGNYFLRGEYFDRVLVFEAGLTLDGEDLLDTNIRNRLAEFIQTVENRLPNATYIFIANTETMANIMYEESFIISDKCKVLYKELPLDASFCINLVSKNLDEFNKGLVYKPKDIENDTPIFDINWSTEHGAETPDLGQEVERIQEIKIDNIEEIDDTEDSKNITDTEKIINFDEEFLDDTIIDIKDTELDTDKETDICIKNNEYDISNIEDTNEIEIDSDFDKQYTPANTHNNDNNLDILDNNNIINGGSIDKLEDDLNITDEQIIDNEFDISTYTDNKELDILNDTNNKIINLEKEESNSLNDINKADIDYNSDNLDIEYNLDEDEIDISDDIYAECNSDEIETDISDNLDIGYNSNDNKTDELDIFRELEDLQIEKSIESGINDIDISDDILGELEDNNNNTKIDELFGFRSEHNEKESNTSVPGFEKSMYTEDNKEDNKQINDIETEETVKRKGLFSKVNKRTKAKSSNTNNFSDTDKKVQEVIKVLGTFKNRGSSLVVTGTPCSGKSTLVYNIANTVVKLGYVVLIVDMDTINRAQSFISKQSYDAVHSLDPENASLKQAVNAVNTGISRYTNIVKTGLHLLTMGLAGDIVSGEKLAPKQKISRFASNVRNNYNLIIYDIPFDIAVDYASEIVYTADNIVLCAESSNHGLMSMMMAMCNIDSEDMQETMFNRAQLCLTKYKGFNKVLSNKVKGIRDILYRLDTEVESLLGIEPEYYFSNLMYCGTMAYNDAYEDTWFSDTAYSDTKDGEREYIDLLSNILLKDKQIY